MLLPHKLLLRTFFFFGFIVIAFAPSITGAGLFKWLTDSTAAGLTKSFTAMITDPCGGADTAPSGVQILDHVPQVFTIEKTYGSLMGTIAEVSIFRQTGSARLDGFELLIAFDAYPLNFVSARPGDGLNACGWEYFSYEYIPSGYDCGANCRGALVRITAIADVNNVAGSPSCSQLATGAEIAKLQFYIAIDPAFECFYLPIRFAWLDCRDNSATNVTGDTLWISSRVFDFENSDPLNDPNHEITDTICSPEISYGGACADCDDGGALTAVRDIYFRHGGIDIPCDNNEFNGDVNINFFPYDIGDASLLAEYFTGGLGVFTINVAAQVAESDANYDGFPLTPADLTYLLRVIVGDALPYPTLHPFETNAYVDSLGGIISIDSPDPVAAVYMTFDIEGEIVIDNYTDLLLNYAEREGKLHVLLWPGMTNMSASIASGLNQIIHVHDAKLDAIQISDYNGNMLNPLLARRVLPSEFHLTQNFPNPFNPVTRISIELPTLSDWSLDIVNVTGQIIESFQGTNIGIVSIDWDARSYPSGVYFYRATMGKYTETRKMLLLK